MCFCAEVKQCRCLEGPLGPGAVLALPVTSHPESDPFSAANRIEVRKLFGELKRRQSDDGLKLDGAPKGLSP